MELKKKISEDIFLLSNALSVVIIKHVPDIWSLLLRPCGPDSWDSPVFVFESQLRVLLPNSIHCSPLPLHVSLLFFFLCVCLLLVSLLLCFSEREKEGRGEKSEYCWINSVVLLCDYVWI